MSLRRITGSLARLDNLLVNCPQSSPWPMCRTCWQQVEEIGLLEDPEISPGRNKLHVKVYAKCHGEEEVMTVDLMSEETLAQDPDAISKVMARWPFFNPKLGHVGN